MIYFPPVHVRNMICLLLLICTATQVSGLTSKSPSPVSTRRVFFSSGITTIATTAMVISTSCEPAFASNSNMFRETDQTLSQEKKNLLQKILLKETDEEIQIAMAKLENIDPSQGKAATSGQLGGTWELIYSLNAEAFSPLLNLPKPIRPTSLQLLGDDAAKVVGSGRVAQILNFPIIPLSLILSSGVVPVTSDPTMLEIFPPFRLEAKLGDIKAQLVESKSDSDFRALNARDDEAQAAGRNMYKQRYLDISGRKGDLRISEVTSGDPVIVGAIFVHQRI